MPRVQASGLSPSSRSNSAVNDLVPYDDGFATNLIGMAWQIAERIVTRRPN